MLFVAVNSCNSLLMMPNTVKGDGFLLHQFVIPGFDFMLAIGRNEPATFDKFCLLNSPERPIVVSERGDTRRLDQLLRTMDVADAYRTGPPRKGGASKYRSA